MALAPLSRTKRLAAIAASHPFVAVPFIFYFLTCSRGIGMSDTAILIGDILDRRISAAVNSHNLSVVFGQAFTALPIGSLAFRANLMSVFFGGLAVSLFYALAFLSFRSRAVATMAAGLLMVSHSMWWHSTIVESYAINACLVVGALLLISRWQEAPREDHVLGLVGLAGLSVFHHAQLGVIGLAALVVAGGHAARLARGESPRREIPRFLARTAAVAAVSLLPFGLALARDVAAAGGLASAVSDAGGGPFKEIMFRWEGGLGVLDTLQLTTVQFPSPFLLLIPVGCLGFLQRWGKSAATLAVLVIVSVNTGFFLFFHTWDRFAFLLVSFIVLAYWGAFALDQLVTWAAQDASRRLAWAIGALFAVSVAAPPWVYARMSSWRADPASVWAMRFGAGPASAVVDVARFVANPNKRRYDDIEAFFGSLFETLPPDAVYVDDDSRFYTLEYLRLHDRRRPDLQTALVNSFGFSDWGLSRADFQALLEYAHEADLPLFVPTLAPPFDGLLEGSSRTYRFEVVPLGGSRFVHRLRTGADEGVAPTPPFAPTPRGMHVVRGRDPMAPDVVAPVGRDDALAVRVNFERTARPFPLVFRWTGPDGRPRFSSPIHVVPPDSGAAAWIHERRGVLVPGTWRVETWVGSRAIEGATFEVR